MPNVSQDQRSAMAAAAKGKSTLGIPKSVGKKYMREDPGGKLPKKVSRKKQKRGKRRQSLK